MVVTVKLRIMDALFTTEPFDQFQNISHIILNNLYVTDDRATIEPDGIEDAKQEMKQLITDSNFNLDEVAAIIKSKSWDQNKINHFITVLQERRTDLLYTILAHSNSAHGESLTNFNWFLKLVLGSSELKSLRYPFLQLVLHTKSYNGKEKQTMYELNKEALCKIISILEAI